MADNNEPTLQNALDAVSRSRRWAIVGITTTSASPELRGQVVLLDGSPGGDGVEIRVRTPGSKDALDSAHTIVDGSFALEVELNRTPWRSPSCAP